MDNINCINNLVQIVVSDKAVIDDLAMLKEAYKKLGKEILKRESPSLNNYTRKL